MTQTYLLPEPAVATVSRLHLRWNRDVEMAPEMPLRGAGVGGYQSFRISSSVRLDNRYELCADLGLRRADSGHLSEADLIAAAYARWGEGCLDKLIGDFAFAIWDPAARRLFCARDSFGVKPFYYFCSPDLFVCATEVDALLAHPDVPNEVNRARVADFLVQDLEGVDDTSTFYRQIHRLPPAHLLEITPEAFTKRRFWELTPGEELVLDSDAEYARAFWNELSIAVGRRHRDTRKTAVMLSGGLDSSSIVAAALELDPEERRAIRTISIVADREPHCIESKCIEAVIAEDSIKSRVLSIDHLAAYQDPLLDSLRGSTDPFDFWMTLPRMIYLASHRAGFTRVIDGVDGDLVVSHGASLIASLLRQGRCLRAMEEARGQSHFHYRERSAIDILVGAARQAWIPERLRKSKRSRAQETWLANHLEGSVIHPDFAVEVGLTDRLERLEAQRRSHLDDLRRDQANLISHPYTVAALERYHRAASAFGIEPLHPYFDRELVEFCLSLPLDQRVKCGWTKYVVRQAAQGKLPTDVVWRKGDWRRLNTEVTERVVAFHRERIGDLIASGLGDGLKGWVDEGLVRASWEAYLGNAGRDATEVVWQVAALAMWLEGTGSKKASGGLI